jgi:hypothetical protein
MRNVEPGDCQPHYMAGLQEELLPGRLEEEVVGRFKCNNVPGVLQALERAMLSEMSACKVIRHLE